MSNLAVSLESELCNTGFPYLPCSFSYLFKSPQPPPHLLWKSWSLFYVPNISFEDIRIWSLVLTHVRPI